MRPKGGRWVYKGAQKGCPLEVFGHVSGHPSGNARALFATWKGPAARFRVVSPKSGEIAGLAFHSLGGGILGWAYQLADRAVKFSCYLEESRQ